ncbi:MAG: hypothetical protein M3464_17925, partial [Chloroflexota bacterium]|nr:hypothetical protein [Chloroflexota bacterium]
MINPTLLAFIVAGGVTAALAYMVLSAGSSLLPERPEPAGTAITAPTEQALATVAPTRSPDQTPNPTAEESALEQARTVSDERPEATLPTTVPGDPEPTTAPEVPEPTPTPRVVNVQAPASTPTPTPGPTSI